MLEIDSESRQIFMIREHEWASLVITTDDWAETDMIHIKIIWNQMDRYVDIDDHVTYIHPQVRYISW